jgi:hypothetical protein
MSPKTVAAPCRASPADGPELHRGEVLRLVEHDVAEAGGAVDDVGELVEQDGVGRAPADCSPGLRWVRPLQERALLHGEQPVGLSGELARVGQEAEQHVARVDRGPQPTGIPLDRRAACDCVLHPVVRRVAGPLHLEQHRMGKPLGKHRAGRVVADTAAPQFLQNLVDLVCRYAPLADAARDDQRFGGASHP